MVKDVSNRPEGTPQTSERREIDAFLERVRATPAPTGGKRGRLVFAMDATASRQPQWDRALHIQAEMFDATAELGGLEVQLMFFRGFGECRASRWYVDGRALRDAMLTVRCMGGRTQIERVLARALRETRRQRVQALVYVGDCMEENADRLCHQAGELGMLGVPIFLFHEGGEPVARRTFQQMAKLSRGAYCPFDAASAETLKELLRAVAVYAAGGRKALADHGAKNRAVAGLLEQLK